MFQTYSKYIKWYNTLVHNYLNMKYFFLRTLKESIKHYIYICKTVFSSILSTRFLLFMEVSTIIKSGLILSLAFAIYLCICKFYGAFCNFKLYIKCVISNFFHSTLFLDLFMLTDTAVIHLFWLLRNIPWCEYIMMYLSVFKLIKL